LWWHKNLGLDGNILHVCTIAGFEKSNRYLLLWSYFVRAD